MFIILKSNFTQRNNQKRRVTKYKMAEFVVVVAVVVGNIMLNGIDVPPLLLHPYAGI